uniref:Gypsy retrotransposon integrase-like protein 1 n=1 Tax=Cyprinus carpio TaxID=7962 RepID=A0A8C1R0T5_CYPCA
MAAQFALYAEVKYYLETGNYHEETVRSDGQRKRVVRRASKKFKVQDGHLFLSDKGSNRLVIMDEKQKERVLQECHDNPGTGGHQGRARTYDKIAQSYYWLGIMEDIKQWVRCMDSHNDTIKTVAPVMHPIKVTEPWTIIGMDLMGPFPVTPQGNSYVLTMTDLFTKWVIAEPLKNKTAPEVAAVVLDKLFEFGAVERIITDQGREFDMFKVLGVKQCVTSAYHPQSNGQDERTNQTIKRALSKYCNDKQNDWDKHLKGVVYAINTSKQASTKYTPYLLMFNRHPLMAGVLNTKHESQADCFAVENPEVSIDARIAEVTALRSKTDYESRKRKNVKSFHIHEGEEVLKANKRKEGRKGGRLESNWTGPFVVKDITEKGLATLADKSGKILCQKTNVSQLKPFLRRNIKMDGEELHISDHEYTKKTDRAVAGGDAVSGKFLLISEFS